MDKYCGLIIADSRGATGETDYSDDNGIPQSVLITELNDAQKYCQSELIMKYPRVFDVDFSITAVPGTFEYGLPANSYLGGSLLYVGYSTNGLAETAYELGRKERRFKSSKTSGAPSKWIPGRPGYVTIDPAPSSAGTIFVVGAERVNTVDLRRGTIEEAPILDGPMTNYVSIKLLQDSYLDEATLALNDYICINSVDGEIKYENIRYSYSTGYNSTTRVLTFFSPVPVADGLIELGDFITCGKYSSTHSSLDDICEPILRAFVNRRLYMGKSSSDIDAENDNIKGFTAAMIKAYGKKDRGPKKWPYKGVME